MKNKWRVLFVAFIFLFFCNRAFAEKLTWTFALHPSDVVVGPALNKLHTRHRWRQFDEQSGDFEVAIKKSTFPASAPQCRMEYLILEIPFYYPESPQASLSERRKMYDALLAMQETGKGSLSVHVDALYFARQTPSGPALTACNIYFVLPLAKDAAKLSP